MTIGDFMPIYERNHVAFLKTAKAATRRLNRHIGRLAAHELGELTRLQVMDWFHGIAKAESPIVANHALESLHGFYVKAEDWGVFDGKNPAARIKKFPERSRERFIQTHEMPYLMASIQEEMPRTEVYFLTLLLTGARRDEARTMKWQDLDLERALWHKPTTKTGVPHTIPLPAHLLVRLRALPRINEWVFPSEPNNKNHNQPGQWSGTAIQHAWRRIRARVGLKDVRIHDLRRTAASWLAIDGANLPVIQSMLNHTSLSSTQVYARLSIAPVRQALDAQAERILAPVPAALPAPEERVLMEWPG